jgi:hypothetical protein
MAVELYIEDELIDLIGDEKIQTDYAIAEIGNFSTRQGFRGINFDIPKTANNKAILGNSDIVNNTTLRPYRRLKARVYVDGIDQNIRFADIESIQDNFNIRLYGGNASFFDAIKNKQLRELSYLPSLNHEFNLTNVYDSRDNTDGYVYPLIDWHADSPNAIMNNDFKTFDVRYCYPCLFVDEMLENICSDAGYTLVNNLLNDINYQKADLILPVTKATPNATKGNAIFSGNNISIFDKVFVPLASDLRYNIVPLTIENGIDIEAVTGTFQNDGFGTGYVLDPFTATINYFEIPYAGEYNFSINVNATAVDSLISVCVICKINGLTLEETSAVSVFSGVGAVEHNINYTAEFAKGEQICLLFISIESYITASPLDITDIKFEVISNNLGIQINREVNFEFLESSIKQTDLLKAYLQMFCLLVQVDEPTKTVTINKFNEISNNIGLALDWSSKLDYTDNEQLEFELDKYAQSNTLTYKEDDSIDPTFIQGSNGTINIDDETLDSEEEFVELPFSATEMDSRLQAFVIPKIKIFRTNDDSPPETKPTDKVEPRILFLNRETTVPSVIYSDGTSTLTTNVDLPLPWFMLAGKEVNLGFANNLIPLYYGGLQSVLTRTKIVTENIRLNALDIQQLDFLKPIYLDKHNAYFYISKISGFDYGSSESTEVELVKIR